MVPHTNKRLKYHGLRRAAMRLSAFRPQPDQLQRFGSGVWIVDNWSIGEAARNLPFFRFAGEPTPLTARAQLFTFKPASCGVWCVFRASIEGNGRIGSAFVHSIDERLKEQQAFWGNTYPAADHNAIVS